MEKFCFVCKVSFNLVGYIRHIQEMHQGNEHICMICQKSFHRPRDLKGHFGRYHGTIEVEEDQSTENSWLCPECGFFGKTADQPKHICVMDITDIVSPSVVIESRGFNIQPEGTMNDHKLACDSKNQSTDQYLCEKQEKKGM